MLGVLAFTAYPILASGYYSFTDYSILSKPHWVGLQNYSRLLHDPLFWQSLKVTGIYCVAVVPGTVIIGYAIALLLSRRVKWLSVWRTIYFLPSIVPLIATAFIWAWMFNPDVGVVNGVLKWFGIKGPGWLSSTTWALPAYILIALWSAGGNLILYLAALQQVPTTYYDAARLDGANSLRLLYHITIPFTSPIILFTFITSMISSFQVFTVAFAVTPPQGTPGGPANASLFYVVYLYQKGWRDLQMGYASALAWVMLVLILAFTAVTLALARRFVYYEFEGR